MLSFQDRSRGTCSGQGRCELRPGLPASCLPIRTSGSTATATTGSQLRQPIARWSPNHRRTNSRKKARTATDSASQMA